MKFFLMIKLVDAKTTQRSLSFVSFSSTSQVIDDPNRKMGHAFVLAMLLRGEKLWETDNIPE